MGKGNVQRFQRDWSELSQFLNLDTTDEEEEEGEEEEEEEEKGEEEEEGE